MGTLNVIVTPPRIVYDKNKSLVAKIGRDFRFTSRCDKISPVVLQLGYEFSGKMRRTFGKSLLFFVCVDTVKLLLTRKDIKI